MDRIPNEVLDRILALVPKDDLYNCRLVCKSLGDFAGHQVFHTVHFAIFPHYLERLFKIASHPRLRTFVRRLIVDGTILDENLMKYEVWSQEVDPQTKEVVKRQFWMKERLSADESFKLHPQWSWRKHQHGYHHRLVKMVIMQLDLFENGFGIECLRNILRQLPNLNEVVYIREDHGRSYFEPCKKRFDKCVLAQVQVVPHRTVTGTRHDDLAVIRKIFHQTLIDPRTINGTYADSLSNIQPLALLLSSLDYPGSPGLQQLVWREMPRRLFHHESIDGWLYIIGLMNSAQNLRKMDLKVPLGSLGPIMYENANSQGSLLRRLLTLIQKTPCLDTLYLDFITYDRVTDISCNILNDISELLEGITLSRLRDLGLGTCKVSEGAVISLLTRHSRELRSLYLDAVELAFDSEEEGSWKEVMHRIAPKMSLVHVQLFLLQDKETEKILRKFWNIKVGDETIDVKQLRERWQAYADAIAQYLLQRGQVDYPEYSMLHKSSTESAS